MENHVFLQPSQAQLEKRGAPIVPSTVSATRTGINAWGSIQLKPYLTKDKSIQSRTQDWIFQKIKEDVIPDAKPGEPLSKQSLNNLNVSLGEFCVHYRKQNGDRLGPSSLLNYLESINRWLQEFCELKVNIMYDPVFTDKKTGYKMVADNIVRDQQAKGNRPKPHNTLTDIDLKKILTHPCTSPQTSAGHVNRMIVIFGIFLGLRVSALRTLKWSMFKDDIDYRGKNCIRYEGIIGSYAGDCKTQKGGLSAAKTLPTTIMIFDEELPYNINLYKVIMEHHRLCLQTTNKIDVMLKPSTSKRVNANWLSSLVIGEKTLPKYFEGVVKSTNVRGAGPNEKPVMHSLRKTLINSLMRAGFDANQIALRTGHKSIQSILPYANIMGEAGHMQQKSILKSPSPEHEPAKKRRKAEITSTSISEALQTVIQGITNHGTMNVNINVNINKD